MPDGVWFVGFAALEDTALVAASTLRGLGGMGAGARPGQAPLAALTEFLGNKQALLILDHCNRVAPAVAELCATLRPACPGLRILCTAQEPLKVAGEQVYPVPAPAESERNVLAEIHAAQPSTATTAFATNDVTHVDNGRFMKWRELLRAHRLAVAIATLAGIGLLLAATAGLWNSRPVPKEAITAQAAPTAMANAGGLSIVVLPFANLTGDAGQEYVADGITASVTADLSRIHGMFVVNAATAYTHKGKALTPQMAGRDFGVRFMLVGNVQRSGDKIRVNAQLADAISGAQLWSETFESDQADLFTLQDKLTTRIGNSIGREIVIRAARDSEASRSDPKVSDLMLRARALSLRPQSVKNFTEIAALYRRVLVLEPNNVFAIIGLAVYLARPAYNHSYPMDPIAKEKNYIEARNLALRAKEIDPDIPSIYNVLGMYARDHNDFDGVRRAYQRLFSLAPRSPGSHNHLALYHLGAGEPKRAIELLTQEIDLDPNHVSDAVHINMARAHFMLGDNESAIKWGLKALELNPEYGFAYRILALAYAVKGDDAKARAAVAEFRQIQRRNQLPENFDKPFIPPAGAPAAYLEWFETKYLPAARKAGLIE